MLSRRESSSPVVRQPCEKPTWQRTKACQQPREWLWKWIQPQSSPEMTETTQKTQARPKLRDGAKLLPSWPAETERINACCFQPLSFGVTCYTAIVNKNTHLTNLIFVTILSIRNYFFNFTAENIEGQKDNPWEVSKITHHCLNDITTILMLIFWLI